MIIFYSGKFSDFLNLLDSALYINYKFNREQSPGVSVEDWRKVFGNKVNTYEFLFQKEKELNASSKKEKEK